MSGNPSDFTLDWAENQTSNKNIAENVNREDQRMRKVTAADTEAFVQAQKNRNTLRKTAGDMKLFTNWLTGEEEIRHPTEIPPEELNLYLQDCSYP